MQVTLFSFSGCSLSHSTNFAFGLGCALDGRGGFAGVLGFVSLSLGSFLGLGFLDFLFGLSDDLVTGGTVFTALSLDFVEAHANDGLSDLHILLGKTFLDVFDSNLLVLVSPFHGPTEVNSFDTLVVHGTGLFGDEVVGSAITGDKFTSISGVDFEL